MRQAYAILLANAIEDKEGDPSVKAKSAIGFHGTAVYDDTGLAETEREVELQECRDVLRRKGELQTRSVNVSLSQPRTRIRRRVSFDRMDMDSLLSEEFGDALNQMVAQSQMMADVDDDEGGIKDDSTLGSDAEQDLEEEDGDQNEGINMSRSRKSRSIDKASQERDRSLEPNKSMGRGRSIDNQPEDDLHLQIPTYEPPPPPPPGGVALSHAQKANVSSIMVPPGLQFINPNMTSTGFQSMVAPPPPPPTAGSEMAPVQSPLYPGANPMHQLNSMNGFNAPPPPMSPTSFGYGGGPGYAGRA